MSSLEGRLSASIQIASERSSLKLNDDDNNNSCCEIRATIKDEYQILLAFFLLHYTWIKVCNDISNVAGSLQLAKYSNSLLCVIYFVDASSVLKQQDQRQQQQEH